MTFRSVLLLAAIALMQSRAFSAVINVPADQPTIQAAIDAAADGDEVVLAPGDYGEYLNLRGKAITLRSTDPDSGAVVSSTRLTGIQTPEIPRVSCVSGEGPGTVIEGLTITRGNGIGGAILIQNSSPTIRKCRLTRNSRTASGHNGAGIYASDSSPLITDCFFRLNVGSGGGVYAFRSDLTIRACEFRDNGGVLGGAVAGVDSAIVVQDCVFDFNSAHYGGAIHVNNANTNGLVQITGCDFVNNGARMQGGTCFFEAGNVLLSDCHISRSLPVQSNPIDVGGGLYVAAGATVTVEECLFEDNLAETAPALYSAGTLFLRDTRFDGNVGGALNAGVLIEGPAVIERCDFESNMIFPIGAAHVLGVALDPGVAVSLVDCLFEGNGAGAISARQNNGNLYLERCRFMGNGVPFFGDQTPPGAPLISGAMNAGHALNCLFANNTTATDSVILDLENSNDQITSFINCTIYETDAAPAPNILVAPPSNALFVNCILPIDPARYEITGLLTALYSIIAPGFNSTGGIATPPVFVDAAGNDFRLDISSPGIDAGFNSPLLNGVTGDLAGAPRFVDVSTITDTGIGPAPVVDIGAFEVQFDAPACPGDCDGSLVVDFDDLIAIIFRFGDEDAGACDADGSGAVDFTDLIEALFNFGSCAEDCNGNGIPDQIDVSSGFSADCNRNGVPDECDVASGMTMDCNGNGIMDACDVESGFSDDCNGNLVPDECEIADDPSIDSNGDGQIDSCAPIVLLQPLSGTTVPSLTPTLQWEGAVGGQTALIIDDTPGFPSPVVLEFDVPATGSFTVPTGALSSGTSYFWRLAVDTPGAPTFSETWTFTTP